MAMVESFAAMPTMQELDMWLHAINDPFFAMVMTQSQLFTVLSCYHSSISIALLFKLLSLSKKQIAHLLQSIVNTGYCLQCNSVIDRLNFKIVLIFFN